jgi:menaquinone-dependent protoporphyrinogen oxidase
MRVLVTVATRHGATREIGSVIAKALTEAGHDVDELDPSEVALIDPYEAVILGSAVYNVRWLPEARELAERAATPLSHRHVWLFSSGLATQPASAANSPTEMRDLRERVAAHAHRNFAGRLDRTVLSFAERTIIAAARGKEGDHRDLAAAHAWGLGIAAVLAAEMADHPSLPA